MQSNFAAAFGVGLAVIALAVGGIFLMQRGDRIELPGKMLKVRTAPLDEESSIAVIDFRITNPSNVQFEVRTVTVEMEDNQGKSTVGQSVSEMDAKRLFEPFFTTKSAKGTGLGLWISKGIVQKYDGQIRCRSLRLNGGYVTCFSVFLPGSMAVKPAEKGKAQEAIGSR